jgi:hypothetical protein
LSKILILFFILLNVLIWFKKKTEDVVYSWISLKRRFTRGFNYLWFYKNMYIYRVWSVDMPNCARKIKHWHLWNPYTTSQKW